MATVCSLQRRRTPSSKGPRTGQGSNWLLSLSPLYWYEQLNKSLALPLWWTTWNHDLLEKSTFWQRIVPLPSPVSALPHSRSPPVSYLYSTAVLTMPSWVPEAKLSLWWRRGVHTCYTIYHNSSGVLLKNFKHFLILLRMCCSLHICIWEHIHLPHRSTRWRRSKLGETVKRHCCSSTGNRAKVAGPSIAHPRCMQTANGPPGGPGRAGLLGQVGEESLSQWGPRAVLCPWEKVGILQLHIFTNECLNGITVHVKADHGLVKSQKAP